MMKRLLTILSICVLCITAQAQIVIGVTRTGQVGTADQNLEFVDQFGRIMAYPSLGPTGELLDAMRPAVATNLNVSDVTKVSATTGGKVIAEGASAVTECGVCFSTSTNPTTQDAHVTATPDADGNFTVSLTGLQPNTTYHVRAYATNAIGTSYGTAATFTTRGDATITITGASESKIYNATAQSLTGYTVSIPDGVTISDTEISYTGNAVATGINVGEYPLTLAASDFSCSNSNYDVTFQVVAGKLTITKATATVTANDASKVYGATDPTSFTATVNGVLGSDVLNYTVARVSGEDAGTYDINVTLGNNPNYEVTAAKGTFTITPASATVTVTGSTGSQAYNAQEQSVTGYTVNAPSGISESQISYSGTAVAKGTNVGTYSMGLTQDNFTCSNPNFNVTFNVTDGALTITKATATVKADAKSKTYGDPDPALTATVTGVLGNDQLNYTLALPSNYDGRAGDWAIGVTLGDNPNYNVTPTPGLYTVNKKAATIVVDNKTKEYGDADPALTATVSGTVGSDMLNYTLSRDAGENVGDYDITVTKGTNNDYDITITNGTLTITRAAAKVTAEAKEKVYGTTDPQLTATVSGLKNGDAASVITYTVSRAAGENVGTYAITPSGAAEQGNYTVTYASANLTIVPADQITVTITGNTDTKTYNGSEQSVTGYTVSVPSGVSISTDQISYSGTAEAKGTNVGTYPMGLTQGTFTCSNPNYNVTFDVTDGSLAITPAPATVTAVAATKEYGAADPTFTATVTGLKNNDDASVINYTLSRAAGEDVGTYAITPTGEATQGNYTVTYVPADFTITPAAATVTASAKEKVYGETDPTFTATISGLRNPNDASQITYSLSRVSGQDVGTYTITPTGATTQGNYTVAYQTGTLTITPAAATVKADDKTKVAGESDPQFTATVTGLKRNDQPSVLNYSLSRATGETAGTYAITPSGAAEQGNYTVAYQTGTLTITEPACPTLGTTTYTPDPVTGSATTITLTTPVNDVTVGATVTNPQYTVQVGSSTSTVTGTYSNGTMTGTITITSAMRGSAITVTPSITTAGCSNPGTVTGQAVEICVQPVLPSFGTVSNTDAAGKTNLFYRAGSYTYATINNYDASIIQEMGFYISTDRNEVVNHTCAPIVGIYGDVDTRSYSASQMIPLMFGGNPSVQPTYTTALNVKVSLSACGKTTYYQPYMKLNLCGEIVTVYGNSVKSFTMWGPESQESSTVFEPTVSASPNPVSSGSQVTLKTESYMTIQSNNIGQLTIRNAFSQYGWALGSTNISANNWTYRWEDESGNTIHSSHTTGTTTVRPNQTTTYTAFGEFTYGGETCRVSKSIEVTVIP